MEFARSFNNLSKRSLINLFKTLFIQLCSRIQQLLVTPTNIFSLLGRLDHKGRISNILFNFIVFHIGRVLVIFIARHDQSQK
eukprot:09930.XXX_18868_19113_1 [CDS] Oithona nana genome sequencing.